MLSRPNAAAAAIATAAAVGPSAARGTAASGAASPARGTAALRAERRRNREVGHDAAVHGFLQPSRPVAMLVLLRRLQRYDHRRRAIQPRRAAAVPTTAVRTAAATQFACAAALPASSALATAVATSSMRDIIRTT